MEGYFFPKCHARRSHGLNMCKGILRKEDTICHIEECVSSLLSSSDAYTKGVA